MCLSFDDGYYRDKPDGKILNFFSLSEQKKSFTSLNKQSLKPVLLPLAHKKDRLSSTIEAAVTLRARLRKSDNIHRMISITYDFYLFIFLTFKM